MLGKVLPRPKLELNPYGDRLFWEVISPRVRPALSKVFFDQEQAALDRVLPKSCVGYFFDSRTKKTVAVHLGIVTCRLVPAFRPAPLKASQVAGNPFEGEGAGLNAVFFAGEHRPERSEDGAQAGEESPGPYVIPGQVATDCQNMKKIDGFEWSIEKCAREIC